MPCDRPFSLVSAYVDDELPDDERRAFARHLADCPACAALAGELRQIGQALAAAGRETVPAGLPARVRLALAKAAEAQETEPETVIAKAAPSWRRGWPRPALLRQAAVLALACLISALAAGWYVGGAARQDQIERELLSAHLRSLLQDSPIQIASSDAHTVRPWFAGKVDFAPEARDLAAEGYPLLGGRLDSIDGRRVGALVYRRRLHLINVFAWPAADAANLAPRLATRQGYNLLSWSRGGVAYAAISDLDGAELARLPGLL